MIKLDEYIQTELQKYNSQIKIHQLRKAQTYLKEYQIHLYCIKGGGSYGVVFQGYDEYHKRDVAVKIILNLSCDQKKENEEEVKIIKKIQSKFVIKIFEFLYDEDCQCFMIVTEYCQNGQLRSYLQKNRHSREDIINIFSKFLLGLQAIHDQNIIHCDLKPENILLNEKNEPKIIDFGLSITLQNDEMETNNKGGSYLYYSNEQFYNNKARIESDYFAAGLILCFMCDSNFEKKIVQYYLLKDGQSPDVTNEEHKDLFELAFQMMKKDPKERMKPIEVYKILTTPQNKRIIQQINLQEKQNESQNNFKSHQYSDLQKSITKDKNISIQNISNFDYTTTQDCCDQQIELDSRIIEINGTFLLQNEDRYIGCMKNNKRVKKGIYHFKNGDRYEGEFDQDTFHGFGTYFYKNGNKYEGQWSNGKKTKGKFYDLNIGQYDGDFNNEQFNGKGTLLYSNGDKFVGYWYNNKKVGCGLFLFKNGDSYDGEFYYDKISGVGKYFYQNGDKYEGQWQNGFKIKGVLNYYDGNMYDGSFKNNQFCGQGIFKYVCGDRYEGEFQDGKMNGKGKLQYENGDEYDGEWQDGEQSGDGIFYFQQEDEKYEGQFKFGTYHGIGTYFFKDGNIYSGEWRNGYKTKGVLKYFNEDKNKEEKYEGVFKDGKRNGKGKYYYNNGDIYQGQWKNDQRNGFGVYNFKDGSIYKGDFVDDKFHGHGTYLSSHKSKYYGQYKNDQKNGEGYLCFNDGERYRGEFKNGKIDGIGTFHFKNNKTEHALWVQRNYCSIF